MSRISGRLMVVIAVAGAGCARHSRQAPVPVFAQGVWQVRIDIDSAPSRRPSTKPVFGSIDFAAGRYSIDFRLAINRTLPNGAFIATIPRSDDRQPPMYKVTLGDSSSFDEKVVMLGRLVTRDSIVGTWSETILCCSAGGRFTLWRTPRSWR